MFKTIIGHIKVKHVRWLALFATGFVSAAILFGITGGGSDEPIVAPEPVEVVDDTTYDALDATTRCCRS